MATLVTRRGGNRHALNKLYRERERIRTEAWLADHIEPMQERNPAIVAAEDDDIAARRAAFPLH